MILMVVGQV